MNLKTAVETKRKYNEKREEKRKTTEQNRTIKIFMTQITMMV